MKSESVVSEQTNETSKKGYKKRQLFDTSGSMGFRQLKLKHSDDVERKNCDQLLKSVINGIFYCI
ncbi:hypothetical protein D3C85_1814340 [compost metagenome]